MARRSKNKTVWLNRGWFPFYYGFVPSEKAWNDEMTRLAKGSGPEWPTSSGSCWSFRNPKGRLAVLVAAHERCDELSMIEVAGLMTHEATHVFQMLCDDIGEKAPSEEFEAYSIQVISQELFTAYCETRKPEWLKK